MADRAAAAGGGLFVVASLAAGPILPQPPGAGASAAAIRSWYVDHHDAVVTASLLSVVGALGLVLLVAGLRQRRQDTWGSVIGIGGGLLVTMGVLGGLLQAAAAQVAPRLTDDGAVSAVYAVQRAVFFDGPPVVVPLLLGASALTLPRWLGALGAGIGVLGLVAGLADLAQRDGAPTALGLSGFLLTVLWVALTSWALAREGGTSRAFAAAPAIG